jgi:hypothetical protein
MEIMILIPSQIIEFLKRNGATLFKDLYKVISKRQSGYSEQIFSNTIMEMEIQGLIRVYRLPQGKKRIELV